MAAEKKHLLTERITNLQRSWFRQTIKEKSGLWAVSEIDEKIVSAQTSVNTLYLNLRFTRNRMKPKQFFEDELPYFNCYFSQPQPSLHLYKALQSLGLLTTISR